MEIHVDRRSALKAFGGAVLLGSAAGVALDVEAAGAAPAPSGLASLVVPKIGMNRTVYEGTSVKVLKRGPGHTEWSAKPGQLGHCIIFAHRTSYGGPFRKIDLLKEGDPITCGGVTYYVRKTEVIHRSQKGRIFAYPSSLAPNSSTRAISLIACSKSNGKPTSLAYRICVRASA